MVVRVRNNYEKTSTREDEEEDQRDSYYGYDEDLIALYGDIGRSSNLTNIASGANVEVNDRDELELRVVNSELSSLSMKRQLRKKINLAAISFVILFIVFLEIEMTPGGNNDMGSSSDSNHDGSSSPLSQGNDDVMPTMSSSLANIEDICSLEQISSLEGRTTCQSLCQSAFCCFRDGYNSCSSTYGYLCEKYAPCENLLQIGTSESDIQIPLPHAPFNLHDICSSSQAQSIECENACKTANSCCSVDSCHDSNEEICNEYSICFENQQNNNNSYEADDDDDALSVVEKVNKSCSPNRMSLLAVSSFSSGASLETLENNKQECKEICDTRSCCFSRGPSNCYDDNEKWCDEFQSCKILQNSDSSSPPFTPHKPVDIKTDCIEENIETVSDLALCEEACLIAVCCFTSEQCSKRGVNCQDYAVCAPFVEDVDHDDFLYSQQFVGVNDGINGAEDLNVGGENKPDPPNNLEVICDPENNQEGIGLDDCIEACGAALCCIGVGDEDCSFTHQDFCNKYQPCHPFWDMQGYHMNTGDDAYSDMVTSVSSTSSSEGINSPSQNGFHSSSLEEICSHMNLLTSSGHNLCQAECDIATCCIGYGYDCSETKKEMCVEFEPCRLLWEDIGITKNIESSNKYESNGNSNDSAYEGGNDSSIDDICSDSSLQTEDGRKACDERCKDWTCCWASGDDSCFYERSVMCLDYMDCPGARRTRMRRI
eukprot:CAMPEP_0178950390 /NCGR_PEP_ID=MMETSP0789-20121207/6623_1 /TAXON_ID=3005 /ORGANISM="Rhizosolenia setigera, Strain CCMP 1694" /LENGTH=712 /DNA_ID=CAMNT_0020631105 /DNA_START=87 /DNA_END=2225 /DNA_ORIENTATION=-